MLQPQFGSWPTSMRISNSFGLLDLRQSIGLLGRVISSSQGLYLKQENTYTYQTSMPWVGYETTIPASERVKTVQCLDRSATVTGNITIYYNNFREPRCVGYTCWWPCVADTCLEFTWKHILWCDSTINSVKLHWRFFYAHISSDFREKRPR
jgi:hypothetical protein